MLLGRFPAALACAAALAAPAPGQMVTLAEAVKPGDCAKYAVGLTVAGKMILTQDGQKNELKLAAAARHQFSERVLAVDGGMAKKTLRSYETAEAKAAAGPNEIARTLAADRRLVVARRSADGLFCYSPAGPLTREELDTVAEHFNPHCLAGLLPGKAVAVGDTWRLDAAATQAAGQFDELAKNDLAGKLDKVEGGKAQFSITGSAEGTENGAKVKLAVSAAGTFDVASARVVALTWKQADERGDGPVNPASQVEATVTLAREVLADAPKELDDAAAAAVPKDDAPLGPLAHLRYADPKGRYSLLHPREWHVTGQTDTHLILRLLEKGEFIAQATVTQWKKAAPGSHAAVADFKRTLADIPGWVPKGGLDDGEVPTAPGHWLYRVAAQGEMDGLPVVQAFHLLAGPQGDQLVVTFTATPEKQRAVGTRDLGLVNAIDFPSKK